MDDNYEKYVKYKNKYLMLKKEIDKFQLYTNSGGGYFHESNQDKKAMNKRMLSFKSINIKIELKQNTVLYNYLDDNQSKINLSNKMSLPYLYHITLLNFEINMDHPLNTIGNNRQFKLNNFVYKTTKNEKQLTDKFKTFIQNIGLKNKFYECFYGTVETQFETQKYDILGKDDKFFVQSLSYNITDPKITQITKFRTYFYNELRKYIQSIDSDIETRFRPEYISIGGHRYTLIYFDKKSDKKSSQYDESEPFIAVPDFYWGNNVWTPHISLFKLNSYSDSNRHKMLSYAEQNTTYKKIKFILNDDNIENILVE
jgi:hypothetical protein